MNIGKCPYCESVLTEVRTEHINVGQYPEQQWHGISCVCPRCHKILNVQIDQISVMNDTVEKLFAKLRAGR